MDERAIVRRCVGAISYRCEAALSGASDGFWQFDAGQGVRTPQALVHHIASLLFWTCELIGAERGDPGADETPKAEHARLRTAVGRLDRVVQAADLASADIGTAVQGPLADALTHVGQLALLRRLAGETMARHNYSQVDMRLDAAAPEAP